MFSIDNDELNKKPALEKIWKCPTCGKTETVKNSKTYDEKTMQWKESNTLQYVKHEGTLFIVGIKGKNIGTTPKKCQNVKENEQN